MHGVGLQTASEQEETSRSTSVQLLQFSVLVLMWGSVQYDGHPLLCFVSVAPYPYHAPYHTHELWPLKKEVLGWGIMPEQGTLVFTRTGLFQTVLGPGPSYGNTPKNHHRLSVGLLTLVAAATVTSVTFIPNFWRWQNFGTCYLWLWHHPSLYLSHSATLDHRFGAKTERYHHISLMIVITITQCVATLYLQNSFPLTEPTLS